jgi:hypothetical protein
MPAGKGEQVSIKQQEASKKVKSQRTTCFRITDTSEPSAGNTEAGGCLKT